MSIDSGAAVRWSTFVLAAFLLQVAFADQISPGAVHPELMLLVAISAGLVGGPQRGAGIGFASGLLVDLTLHGTFGVTALTYTLVGFAVGSAREALPELPRTLAVAITAAASVVGVVLYATIAQLLGERTFSDPRFISIVAIVSIWNALLCTPLLWLARRTEGTRSAF